MPSPGTVGFIGLGVMGEPMCRNLAAKSGRPVLGFDPNRAPPGIPSAGSIEEMAERCEVVFLSLPGGPEVEEVAARLEALAAGSVVADLSTAPVATARAVHARLAARGIEFADAPVARTREAAQAGTLSIMVGASEETFARIRPLLACMGSDIAHCGAPGAGQTMKLVNNMVLFQNGVALAEALALVAHAGIDARLALEVLSKGSADSFALRNHATKAMLPGVFPERAFSTDYALKDLGYALELAREAGLALGGAENARVMLERAAAAGFGASYWPVIARTLRDS